LAEYAAVDLVYPLGPDTLELVELLHACLDGFEPVAIHEPDAGTWRVFFGTRETRDAAQRALRASLGGRLVSITAADVPDEGWAKRSQDQLTAVQVDQIIVAPPWSIPDRVGHAIVIVIDPSMGFGTGHHATTRLCLRLLQRAPVRGRRAIDVGTGSGVLAIAARKLGAREVAAVDCDPDALQNARENIERNAEGAAITLVEADLSGLEIPPGDVVLANLTSAVLQRYAAVLARLVAPGGDLIASGFAPGDTGDIEQELGRGTVECRHESGWAAARFVFSPPRGT
jgi:ribosomal protein L11 methyltransferase